MGAHASLPDVVLLDLVMPRMDGVAAASLITSRHPAVRVVILTSFGEMERVHAALAGGAVGYLLKDAGPAEVATAILAAAGDGTYLDPAIARRLTTESAAPRPERAARTGARRARPCRARPVQPGNRRRAGDQRADGPHARQPRAAQAPADLTHTSGPGRGAGRTG